MGLGLQEMTAVHSAVDRGATSELAVISPPIAGQKRKNPAVNDDSILTSSATASVGGAAATALLSASSAVTTTNSSAAGADDVIFKGNTGSSLESTPGSSNSKASKRKKKEKKNKKGGGANAISAAPFVSAAHPPDRIKLKVVQTSMLWSLGLANNDPRALGLQISGREYISSVWVLVLRRATGAAASLERMGNWLPSLRGIPAAKNVKLPGTRDNVYGPIEGLLDCPLTRGEEKRRVVELERDSRPRESGEDTRGILTLILSPEDLVKGEYPTFPADVTAAAASAAASASSSASSSSSSPAVGLTDEIYVGASATDDADALWALTLAAEEGDPTLASLMYSIDCEMCITAAGLELTRVSVVNYGGHAIYDRLVLPPRSIVDYNTRYSGISAKTLEGISTTLVDVRRDLRKLLPRNAIIMGHSPENDFRALRLVHTRVVDTALCFAHPSGPPYKPALRHLAERHLGRSIQGSSAGHDSIEDARAVMDLVRMKLTHGPAFGTHVPTTESVFALAARVGLKTSLVAARRATIRRHARHGASIFMANNPEDAIKAVRSVTVKESRLVVVEVEDGEAIVEQQQQQQQGEEEVEKGSSQAAAAAAEDRAAKRMDTHVSALLAAAPPASVLFVLVVPSRQPVNVARAKRRDASKGELAAGGNKDNACNGWTEHDKEALEKAAAAARCGTVFCHVNSPVPPKSQSLTK